MAGLSVPVAQGTISGTGPWTFTPAANFSGVANFSYMVSDGVAPAVPATATLTVYATSDADTVLIDAPLNPSGLTSGNLKVGTSISGSHFVVATDGQDAPGVEIGLRADFRFTGIAPRDPSDLPYFDQSNPPTFYVSCRSGIGNTER